MFFDPLFSKLRLMTSKKNSKLKTTPFLSRNSITMKSRLPGFRSPATAPTNKVAKITLTPVKSSTRTTAKVSAPEKSVIRKPGHFSIRKSGSLFLKASKRRFRRKAPRPVDLSRVRALIARSSLVLGLSAIKSSVLIPNIDTANEQTAALFKATYKKLYRPLSKLKKSPFFNAFYGYRKHRIKLGQFVSFIRFRRSQRKPISRRVPHKILVNLKNKALNTFTFSQVPSVTLYSLKQRFYSSFSAQKKSFKLNFLPRLKKKPRRKVGKAKKRIIRRRRNRRRIQGRVYRSLLKKSRRKKLLRKLSSYNRFSKKFVLLLSKKIRNRSLKRFRRKLFLKKRRAYRSYRG